MSLKTMFFMSSLAVILASCGGSKESDRQQSMEDPSKSMHQQADNHDERADHDEPVHQDDHSDDDVHADRDKQFHQGLQVEHADLNVHADHDEQVHQDDQVDHADHDVHADHDEQVHQDDHDEHAEHDEHTVLDAHEHGSARASVVIEGNSIELEIHAPLANFGFAESGDAVPSSTEFAEFINESRSIAETIDGLCDRTMNGSVTATEGHAEGEITISFSCSQVPSMLEFTLLDTFRDGFKELDVVIISDDRQEASELSSNLRILWIN